MSCSQTSPITLEEGFHQAQNPASQHLAALAPTTQGSWVHTPQECVGSTLVPGEEWELKPGFQTATPSAPHPETKHKDQVFFVSSQTEGHSEEHSRLLSLSYHPHGPVLTLPRLQPPGPPHLVIFSGGEEWEGPLHHGAVSRSRLSFLQYGWGVGVRGRSFPFL